MWDRERSKSARLRRTTAAAAVIAVFAVLLVGLSGVYAGGAGLARGSSPGQETSTGFVPFALANTAIDLNRSQSAGTYAPEYVTVNNSTTLTKLPAVLTVTAATCKWIIVANYTAPSVPASVFHNVQFRNVTTGNDTGTTSDSGHGFKICGGTGIWVNYVYWTYSIYQFSTTSLGTNGVVTVAFGDYPGMTTGPAAISAPFGSGPVTSYGPGVPPPVCPAGGCQGAGLQLIVATNLTFTVTLPFQTNSSTSCSELGQVCSFTRYTFSAAADAANTSASNVIAFTAASKLLVTAAYENWTVSYTSASVSADTGVGGFFAGSSSLFQQVVVQFWYLWVVGLLIVALVGAIASKRRRRGGAPSAR